VKFDFGLFPGHQHGFDRQTLDREAVGLVGGVEDGEGLGFARNDDDRRRDEDVLAAHHRADHLNLADIAVKSGGGAVCARLAVAAAGQSEQESCDCDTSGEN